MTWAGKQSEQPRSFQSPETYLLLTFPFIERGYRKLAHYPAASVLPNSVPSVTKFFFWFSPFLAFFPSAFSTA